MTHHAHTSFSNLSDIARLEHLEAGPFRPTELVFIGGNVDDLPALLASVRPGVEVVVLDSSQDGLAQMAEHLAGRSGQTAIHVVSHG